MRTKLEFKGKDVDEAITKATAKMHVAREELDIEIISTGSSGIFGLCKKKACILVAKKNSTSAPESDQETTDSVLSEPEPAPAVAHVQAEDEQQATPAAPSAPVITDTAAESADEQAVTPSQADKKKKPQKREPKRRNQEPPAPLTEEIADQIKTDLGQLLSLMNFPSEITIEESENNKSKVHITGDFVDDITTGDGQVIDSLQYLMRKIIGKKFPEKIIFSIDAGGFRERRRKELQEQALKLAEEVKETEKTRTIAPLNPAERRIVHLVLQDDKTIRSRSVGDGLFKKILIYLPGKGRSRKRGPRKKKR